MDGWMGGWGLGLKMYSAFSIRYYNRVCHHIDCKPLKCDHFNTVSVGCSRYKAVITVKYVNYPR